MEITECERFFGGCVVDLLSFNVTPVITSESDELPESESDVCETKRETEEFYEI